MKSAFFNKVIVAIIFFILSINAYATHIVGGSLSYIHNGGDSYTITFKMYRDRTGIDVAQFIDVTVLNLDGSATGLNFTLSSSNQAQIPTPSSPCVNDPDPVPSIDSIIYSSTENLPRNAGGYHLIIQHNSGNNSFCNGWMCARNSSIQNLTDPGNVAASYYAFIPGNATWMETFDLANGTTVDNGKTKWSRSLGTPAATSAEVNNGAFQIVANSSPIWNEDFALANGTTVDAGPTAWTVTPGATPPSYYQVTNNEFQIRYASNASIFWESESIDISTYTNGVDLSADLSETGAIDASDNITTEYSVDGGAWNQFTTNGSLSGLFNVATALQANVTGNSVAIRITVTYDGAGNGLERYYIENVGVTAASGATWESESISISSNAGGVNLSVDLSETGTLSANDAITVQYALDGGAWTQFTTNGNLVGDFGTTTATQNGLTGSSIAVRITSSSSIGTYSLDNITVADVALHTNSSPRFKSRPPLIICNGKSFTYDHGAADPDGDSLVYSFFDPYDIQGDVPTATFTDAYTFDNQIQLPTVPWAPGYSATMPFDAGSTLSIDPNTGVITGVPIGVTTNPYVVGVKVEEYRNGVLLGEVTRDYQYSFATCFDPAEAFITSNKNGDTLDVCNGNSITFPNNSTGTPAPTSFEWNFGDGTATSSDATPTHVFTTPGTYTVMLKVNPNVASCVDSATAIALVGFVDAGFTASSSAGCGNAAITFNDSSSSASANNATTGYRYIFGDGTPDETGAVAVGSAATHTYTSSGTYTVSYVVYSTLSCSDTARKVITVEVPPTSTITVGGATSTIEKCANDRTVAISGTASNGVGIWTSSGNGTFAPNDSIAAISYTISDADTVVGSIQLYLTVTGIGGCSSIEAIDTLNINITKEPIADVNVIGNAVVACPYNRTLGLSGLVSNGTGIWTSSGTGTFSPNDSASATSYDITDADTAANSIELILTATGSVACNSVTNKDTLRVSFAPGPSANVGLIKQDTVCANDRIYSIAGAVVNATGSWSSNNGTGIFNPDNSINAISYTVTDADTSTKNINLILTANGNGTCVGYSDTDTLKLSITPAPIATVGVTDTIPVCANAFTIPINGASITNASSSGWTTSGTGTFAPDTTLNANSYTLSNTDTTAGTVYLVLSAQGNDGCSSFTAKDTLTVITSDPPAVSVGVIKTTAVCTNDSSITLNGSVVGAPTGVWTTNNGSGTFSPDSTALNASYKFSSADTARASILLYLTSTNNGSCNAVTDSLLITFDEAPHPLFTINALPVCDKDTTFFTSTAYSVESTLTNWDWKFGDGNTGTGTSTSNLYDSSNSYNATLIVTDANNCVDSVTNTIDIHPLPVANFSSTAQCYADSIFFTDLTTVGPNPISGTISNWEWRFGDGNTGNKQNPGHIYATFGAYTGTLIATSSFGCKDTIAKLLNVQPAPTASFTADSVCLNNATTLTNNSSMDPIGGTITSQKLFFGDGTPVNNTFVTNYTYSTSGSFTSTLIVDASNGCSDTANVEVIIHPLPIVTISNSDFCLIDTAKFTDSSTIASGNLVSWSWDFGDGSSSTDQHPGHLYPQVGTYGVTLNVSSDYGCLGSQSKMVSVQPSPTADFKVDNDVVELNSPINYTDQSLGAIKWNWDFGDSTGTSTASIISYQHLEAGTYDVKLIVENSAACFDSIIKQVIVTLPPRIPNGFTPNGDGVNDVLLVNGGPYVEMEFKILDNWGEFVHYTTDVNNVDSNNKIIGWDGTKNGKDQPIGVYVYVLTATTEDGEVHVTHGEITLLR